MTNNLLSASLVAVASLAASGNAQAQDLRMLNPLNWFGGSSYNSGYANCANGQCFPQPNCANGYCPPNSSGYGYNAYRPSYGTVPVTQYRNTYPATYPTNYRTVPAYQGTPNYQTLPYNPSSNYYRPTQYPQPANSNSPFFR